jgi:hypothetical protein
LNNGRVATTDVNENLGRRRIIVDPSVFVNLEILIEEKSRSAIEVERRRRHLPETTVERLRILSDAIAEERHEHVENESGSVRCTRRTDTIDGCLRRITFDGSTARHDDVLDGVRTPVTRRTDVRLS